MFQKNCFYLICIFGLVILLVKSSTELSLSQLDNAGTELRDPKAALEFYYAVIMCLEHRKSTECINEYKLREHLNSSLQIKSEEHDDVNDDTSLKKEPNKRNQQKITINNKNDLMNVFKDVLSKNMKFKSNTIKTSRF